MVEEQLLPDGTNMPATREEGLDRAKTIWNQIDALDNSGQSESDERNKLRNTVYEIQTHWGIRSGEVV